MTHAGRAFILGGKYPSVVKRSRAPFKALLWNTRDKFLSEKTMTALLTALAKDDKTQFIELYGLWDDGHNFGDGDIALVAGVAAKFEKIAKLNPNKVYFFCPFLEHREGNPFMDKVFAKCRAAAPSVLMVNNPISGGGQYYYKDDVVNEMHLDGGLAKPKGKYIVSVDGRADANKGHGNGSVDMDHEKVRVTYEDAFALLEWVLQDNGKANTKDKRKREDRDAWLTVAMDESVCFIGMTQRGEVTLNKGILKSHAEQDIKNPDSHQNNKVCYITEKLKNKKLQIAASNGQVLETLTYSVKYKHGPGYLFRFKRWGYKYAQQARGITGIPTCLLIADGKVLGKFNPGFRQPGR